MTFRLCYVDLPWVYFTTQDVTKQWGDDWNDAPYEHNAGRPYESRENEWEIFQIAIEAEAEQPCDGKLNSGYSVQDINAGRVPWLTLNPYRAPVRIYAGATLAEVCASVLREGGVCYIRPGAISRQVLADLFPYASADAEPSSSSASEPESSA